MKNILNWQESRLQWNRYETREGVMTFFFPSLPLNIKIISDLNISPEFTRTEKRTVYSLSEILADILYVLT